MTLHVLQVDPADGERKESSAMQRHVAFVIALQQTEDVFLLLKIFDDEPLCL